MAWHSRPFTVWPLCIQSGLPDLRMLPGLRPAPSTQNTAASSRKPSLIAPTPFPHRRIYPTHLSCPGPTMSQEQSLGVATRPSFPCAAVKEAQQLCAAQAPPPPSSDPHPQPAGAEKREERDFGSIVHPVQPKVKLTLALKIPASYQNLYDPHAHTGCCPSLHSPAVPSPGPRAPSQLTRACG